MVSRVNLRILGILIIVLVVILNIRPARRFKFKESFNDIIPPPPISSSSHNAIVNSPGAIPTVDPKTVASVTTAIKKTITERPDVILSIKQIVKDPLIKSTLRSILSQ